MTTSLSPEDSVSPSQQTYPPPVWFTQLYAQKCPVSASGFFERGQ